MPRPQRCRRICGLPRVGAFGPQEERAEAPIVLTLDEYEVIRLVDLEEKTQGACAAPGGKSGINSGGAVKRNNPC